MDTQASAKFEATVERTVLRACRPCRDEGVATPHPRLTGDPEDKCPRCGAPATAPEVLETVGAVVDHAAMEAHLAAG